jgi:multisubunit Na+/H+ antiporter MnhB subunit
VKSFLLQELAKLILPLAVLLGLALLLKGHDAPGGGFVAGLSAAVAGVLCFTSYGTRWTREHVPFAPERTALVGGSVLLATIALPLLLGDAALSHRHGLLVLGPLSYKWHTALVFDIGVVMIVGGGLASAAGWLWGAHGEDREGG